MEAAIAQLLGGPAAAEAKARVFSQLKPICSQLLFLRAEPQQLQQTLASLAAAAAAADEVGLQACFDYVMYPLLFMLESIAACRTPPASNSSSSSSSASRTAAVTVPAMKQDVAAEAALQCVLALLQRVRGLEQDQLLPVLQAAAGLLALPPGAATEEVGGWWVGFCLLGSGMLSGCRRATPSRARARPSLLLMHVCLSYVG
jgi:hypothetical protein